MFNISLFDEKWPVVNTINEIKKKIREVEIDIPIWDYVKAEYVAEGNYKFIEKGAICEGDRWDENYTYFFTTAFQAPDDLIGKNLYLDLDICGESEVYIDNVPKGSIDVEHFDVRLSDSIKKGDIFNIKIHATKHVHDFVRSFRAWERPYGHHVFNSSKMASKNRDVEEFYYLARVLLEISVFEEDRKLADTVYEILKSTLYDVDYYEEYVVFVENIKNSAKKMLAEIHNINIGYKYGKALFIGHSHLDLAYKWVWKETVRKVERTLSNTCEVLNNYHEGVYVQSQMKLFEQLENSYPELYKKALSLVNKGRVEAVGDLYVEFDTNLLSGESIIRQILYGKEFRKNHFSGESRVFYLPDSFGYSGILPQILIQAGYQYFVTTKLEWNDTNKPPYLFFNWKGIDSTGIVSHLIADNYEGDTGFQRICKYSSDPRQKGLPDARIYHYGAGDGGGGISEEMILSKMALKKLGCLVEVCDETLEKSLEIISYDLPELPEINGELYFEKHRGVYTSLGAIKRGNRKSELCLRDAEILSILAWNNGFTYPKDQLKAAWKKLLFNHFHDIISGSCISEAADEAAKELKEVIGLGNGIIQNAVQSMVSEGNSIIVWNTLGWKRNEIIEVELDKKYAFVADGEDKINFQTVGIDENSRTVLLDVRNIPALGYKKLFLKEFTHVKEELIEKEENAYILQNEIYKIVFDKAGEMTSIIDKSNMREILKGKGNAIVGYFDRPGYFESFDIIPDFERKAFPIQDVSEMKLVESGPLRWVMKISKRFRKSVIHQYISIYSHNRRIDIKTEIDFFEPQILLKASFDLNVDAPFATYDISMGNIQRPTTRNNSIEAAKFEVNMHKWMDLSNDGYGIALLNDCKYGCDVKDNRMRITLLKTSTFPNVKQDIGHHELTYSIFPHCGDFREGNVTKAAYELNSPCIITKGEIKENEFSWMDIDNSSVIVETVKKAENDDGIIIRLYESNGESGSVRLGFGRKIKKAEMCGVLENVLKGMPFENEKLIFQMKPYEIATIKLSF